MEPIMQKKVNELLEKADEKFYNRDYSEANNIYQQIVTIDEKNGKAIIYMILCLIASTPTPSPLCNTQNMSTFSSSIRLGLDTIKSELGTDDKTYTEICLKIYDDFINSIMSCYENISSYYQNATNLYNQTTNRIMQMGGHFANSSQLQQAKQISDSSYKNWQTADQSYTLATRVLITFNNEISSYIVQKIKDSSYISSKQIQKIYDNVGKVYHLDDSQGIHIDFVKEKTSEVLFQIGMLRSYMKDKEAEKYWKDNPERKKELDDLKDKYNNEKIEIEDKIHILKREIGDIKTNINNDCEKDEINKRKALQEKATLTVQKDSLGIFKVKEKLLLQNKIDEKQAEIEQIDNKISIKKSNLESKYKPTIDEKNKEIESLKVNIKQLEEKIKIIEKELKLEED